MTTRKKDYYEVLGIPRNATGEAIKRAFRKLAMEYHPDKNKEAGAEARFKEINEAYQVLSDTEKRSQYDRFGHAGVSGNGSPGRGFEGFDPFSGFGDIFDSFFGGFGARTRTSTQRGQDLQYAMTISFEEAVFGADKELEITRPEVCGHCKGTKMEPGSKAATCENCQGLGQVRRVHNSIFGQFAQVSTCSVCKGEGKVITSRCSKCRGTGAERRSRTLLVKIPAGIDDGSQIRLTGEGEPGVNGGPAGHLYISLTVSPHDYLKRDGNNILYRLPISFAQAALGDTVRVPTLGGREELKIPEGIQSGSVLRMKGKGVPYLNSNRRGDQLVSVMVVTPSSLNSHQRQLFEEMAKNIDEPKKAPSGDSGWFGKIKDTFNNSD